MSGKAPAPRWVGALAVIAVLAAATACGGSTSGDGGGDGGARSGSSTPSPAGDDDSGPLTTAELEKAALEDGDQVGDYTVSVPLLEPTEDLLEHRADRPECQPLVSLAAGATDTDPAAEVNREVDLDGKITGRRVDVQLRSYGSGGAARVLKALRKAGTACADGFVEERVSVEARYLSVEPVEAPLLGDEAVAYRLRVQDVGNRELVLTEYLTVVRSGATTLSFRLWEMSTEDPGGVPEDLVTEQWDAFWRATIARRGA